MKIIKLTAENVKRLRAVEITPTSDIVTITGRNAQGKTSVLDAIWLALGGGAASRETARPIRDGEATASVTLDLGDLAVTRTWAGDKTALTVKNADGAKYSSPQRMLDELVGRLSFDPLEFTRLSPREQMTALLDLVDLDVDLDALAAERERLYVERTEIGRQGKALGDPPDVDDHLPTEETAASEIIAKIREAEGENRAIDEAHRLARDMRAGYESQRAAVTRLKEDLAQAERALRRQADALTEQDALAESMTRVDAAPLEAALATVEATNARIRANNAAREARDVQWALRQQYEALTRDIAAIDQRKSDALTKVTFPVDGLGFGESGVTFQGVPFSQASSAEQIRVSLAMAMGLNPKLRVIRILDGSLLDADNLALISDAASTHDYQVWIERVSDQSESAVVIEDGSVITP